MKIGDRTSKKKIEFIVCELDPVVYDIVIESGAVVGKIYWYSEFSKYVASFDNLFVFDEDYLLDIRNFLLNLSSMR